MTTTPDIMGWIQTTNRNQVSFKDSEMDEPLEWSDSRTANVSEDLETHLTNTYYSITSTDSDGDSDETDDETESEADE